MNLQTIRSQLTSFLGEEHTFIYYGMRGQNEKFIGKIVHIYPRIFLILTNKGEIKSFSYSDFVIHSLKIVG